jgi:hypothetical protein
MCTDSTSKHEIMQMVYKTQSPTIQAFSTRNSKKKLKFSKTICRLAGLLLRRFISTYQENA